MIGFVCEGEGGEYPVKTLVEMDNQCAFPALLRAFCYFALALGYQGETIARELDEETAKDLGLEPREVRE